MGDKLAEKEAALNTPTGQWVQKWANEKGIVLDIVVDKREEVQTLFIFR